MGEISKINEVNFAEHIYEFIRFYKNHQKLNEEISGLREKRYWEFGVEKVILIRRENFWIGLKTLYAFIIDNIHYVKRYNDSQSLLNEFDKLESAFTEDAEYFKLATKQSKGIPLTVSEDIDFTIRYTKYLIAAFELGYKLNKLLQTTLMVNIKNTKDLVFREERQFYESLANYRNSLVEDLANYRLKNTFEHFKKVIGYYYTYKVLFLSEEMNLMDRSIEIIYEIILSEEVIAMIKEANSDNPKSSIKSKNFTMDMKYALCKLYAQTNHFLSERNILPKRKAKMNMDYTLI